MGNRTCTIDGCDRRHEARGYCANHYYRLRQNGDPNKVERIIGDDDRRFRSYVRETATGCWEWTGSLDTGGYGTFSVKSRLITAHRWAYQRFVGPVPDGLHLDHLCRNRACCNPEHLEPVVPQVNVIRGEAPAAMQAKQTHCWRGHLLPSYAPGKRRHCAECDRVRQGR